jgi:hypothetical protein
MIVYSGSVQDAHELIQFFRREAGGLRSLRRVVISKQKTVVLDVNGDGIEFPALTYGCSALEELLRELGVIFTPQNLHNPNATATGIKEFEVSARWTWGHDRVM